MSKITDAVLALAAPAAGELGLEIWDVEYVREAGRWVLRIYIDREGGVSINRTLLPFSGTTTENFDAG